MVKIMMKDDSIKELNWYDDIPQYIWHELVFFETYGSYQWDWIMVSKKENKVYLWRWYYGSCSWCDNYCFFESEESHDEEWNSLPMSQEKWDEFVYAYNPEEEYNIEDITEDILYKYVKKQLLEEWYQDLTDEKCREIAKEILNNI